MALNHLEPASERDLYWEWVRAEVDVPPGGPRYADRLVHGLDERRLALLAQGKPEQLTGSDWGEVRAAYRRLRGDFLDPLLGSGTAWSYGSLPIRELGDVKIPNLTKSLLPIAPSRRLEELVRALEDGKETPGLPNHLVYRHLRPRFELERMRGTPVLIAAQTAGPYVLAEGLTRTCVLLSRRLRGERTPASLRVLVGVTPRAPEWRWW